MESQGGQIGVRSQAGEGSTFWIEVPATEAPAKPGEVLENGAAGREGPVRPESQRITVRYIEDSVSNFTLVETLLKRYPQVELIVAMQGVLGMEIARTHWPAVILLDLQLPDIRATRCCAGSSRNRPRAETP